MRKIKSSLPSLVVNERTHQIGQLEMEYTLKQKDASLGLTERKCSGLEKAILLSLYTFYLCVHLLPCQKHQRPPTVIGVTRMV